MPPELDFWHENNNSHSPFEAKQSSGVNNNNKGGIMPTLRPPLYNAEDYTAALKQMFSSSPSISLLIDHSGFSGSSSPDSIGGGVGGANPPEMSMRKFLNGSELLFKLEADLRSSYPTFVQEFFHCDGISFVLEALKSIQAALDECTGLREQRKLILDEQKCLQCLKLCLRNIEAVSKLASFSGGLYSLAAATISTVTATRIMALEILACVCTEGGADGHYKVSEAISTLRLRMGEPIRCKLLVGALSSAPPGTFQSKGIRFLTAWVSSAASPKQKVHIQCELEEAGFNPQGIRKAAELGGARESQEVQAELDEWDRATIDVDTMTRQNCQLRNSVATLQQELATLKDKLKRMDIPQKQEKPSQSKRSTRPPKRSEELVTTPVDSEEEAEQIHQILEDLNNIVNSEMNGANEHVNKNNASNNEGHNRKSSAKKEKEIVPVHLVKSPPKRSPGNGVSTNVMPRPWPGSSASDDDDSDILDLCTDENKKSSRAQLGNPHELPNNKKSNSPPLPPNSSPGKGKVNNSSSSANVRRVVEQLEKSVNNGPSPKLFQKQNKFPLNQIGKSINLHQNSASSPNVGSGSNNNNNNNNIVSEPKPDYTLPNFHKQNHMASKFANFKSSKLYSSSPDNSSKNYSNSYAEVYEKSSNSINSSGGGSRYNFGSRFSPNLDMGKKNTSNGVNGNNHHSSGLRRSESLHASLASIELDNRNGGAGNGQGEIMGNGKYGRPLDNMNHSQNFNNMKSSNSVISWKSMENLDNHDENFTLRWRYPHPQFQQQQQQQRSLTPSPKNSKGKTQKKLAQKSQGVLIPAGNSNGNGDLHLIADYRQNRFTKNSKANGAHVTPPPPGYNNNHVSSANGNGNNNGLFPRYAKKSTDKPHHLHPQQQHQIPFSASSSNNNNHHNEYQKEKENLKMFSLPPMLMTSSGPDSANTHRLCDLPSGLY